MIEYYQESFKKFFSFKSSLEKVVKNKRGLELVASRSSGHETNSEKLLYSLYFIWPSLVMYVKQFLSYSKSYICKFIQVNSWHKLFHFHLTFWIWKKWKGRENTQKFKYLENKKSFFDVIKNIFHRFLRAIIWWRNKNLIKNSRHKI